MQQFVSSVMWHPVWNSIRLPIWYPMWCTTRYYIGYTLDVTLGAILSAQLVTNVASTFRHKYAPHGNAQGGGVHSV